ncbi:catalase [Calidifontibacter sp. DB0510]|uniref:Catalase n=1 Tax=Metallococcus carri TaxID=1656884 RepID=A0A967EAT5_9MICO|nr:catalase [Metallococcus carri]NHN56580.1 catalase [Metallococcus carri]NOP38879.1 catalase [Calidifontibacter sp. DB2511S]
MTSETTPKKSAKAPERAPSKTPEPTEVGDVSYGNGGELHQSPSEGQVMTTAQGVPMSDDQNSLKVGDRGPTLLEDFAMREKIFHFDHERIPERVVHARGYGAHGVFECTDPIPEITQAGLFAEKGKQTETFVRFSTVAGNLGSPDLARDVRGFAVKFYTDEGNWDLVGNNIPVFFIQDAIKFPDLVHSVKEEQDKGWPQAQSAHDTFWDFVSLMPEATHMTLWQMSDRAIPRSLRFMQGFGVHTFRFVNAEGGSTYVKFHWTPVQGVQSVVWNEAVKINGADPDFHRRDLWDAIQSGDFPQWDLGVQLFDDEFADSFDFDILDPTKVVPEELVPIRTIGRMTLNRVVDNVFDETEQVAFCTGNVVPGIDFTNDPLLQGRNFSYLDTQLKRLGSTNFTQIPVNAPRCPVAHFQRDGHMQMAQHSGTANYEPNSYAGANRGPRADAEQGYRTVAREEAGPTRRVRAESFADHYSQARQFWISQSEVEQQHIIDGYTFELGKVVSPDIRSRVLANLRNVDEQLAATIADGLGLDLPKASKPAAKVRTDLDPSPKLSMTAYLPESFAGRKIGLLISDGADAKLVKAIQTTANKAGVLVSVVAPKAGGAKLSDGTLLEAEDAIAGGPSVLFDAVALVPGEESVAQLAKHPAAKDFVNDAFNHFKFVAYAESAQPLFDATGVEPDDGFVKVGAAKDVTTFLETCAALRFWDREVFTG